MNFTISGVAFKDLSTGIFVGKGPDSNSVYRASAFRYTKNGSGNPVWTDITPPLASIAMWISDVVITGNTAYAVGEKKDASGNRSGIVLRSIFSIGSGGFPQFEVLPDSPSGGFPLCRTNDPLTDLGEWITPVLIEAEIHPTTLELWVAGQCGRVWKRSGAGVWTDSFKSQTDTNINGMTFGVGTSSVAGYFGGHRTEYPQSCVVRFQ